MIHATRPTPRALLTLAALALLAGCDGRELPPLAPPIDVGPIEPEPDAGPPVEPEPPTLTPAGGSMAGYFEVSVDLAGQPFGASAVEAVELGEIGGIRLVAEGETLRFTAQGHPSPGAVALTLYTADGSHTWSDAFTYDPPLVEGIDHIVAVGASVSQGFQAGAPTAEGMLGSPPAWVARQMGAWLPLPLFVEGLFPAFTVDDVGPPPLCETPDVTAWLTAAVGPLVPKVTDPMRGGTRGALGRVDPSLPPALLALAGSTVADVLYGPGGAGSILMARLVYAIDGGIFEAVEESPLDRAESLAPDILLALDFYGNDVLLEPPAATEEAEAALREALFADIAAAVERMAATGAHVFVGDIPPTSVMPESRALRAIAVRDGGEAAGEAYDEGLVITDERTRLANEALYAAAARFDNVHLVPTAQAVLDLVETPLELGGQTLSIEMFGGLMGLDGTHFTDVGYALTANLAIDAINAALGTDVPRVDLARVLEGDPESPAALRAAGLPIDECLP